MLCTPSLIAGAITWLDVMDSTVAFAGPTATFMPGRKPMPSTSTGPPREALTRDGVTLSPYNTRMR